MGLYSLCGCPGPLYAVLCPKGAGEGRLATDYSERNWLFMLIRIILVSNAVTLSPIIRWQKWLLWSKPTPERTFVAEFADYDIRLFEGGTGHGRVRRVRDHPADVTYGFGVFHPDSTMVFQMQVRPGCRNSIIWKLEERAFAGHPRAEA